MDRERLLQQFLKRPARSVPIVPTPAQIPTRHPSSNFFPQYPRPNLSPGEEDVWNSVGIGAVLQTPFSPHFGLPTAPPSDCTIEEWRLYMDRARRQSYEEYLQNKNYPDPHLVYCDKLNADAQYPDPTNQRLTTTPGLSPEAGLRLAQAHSNMQAASQQALHQQMLARNAAIQAQNESVARSREPTDMNLPEGLEDIIGQDLTKCYNDLRESERKLDATILRKRMEFADPNRKFFPVTKGMRIWVSNTCDGQHWQSSAGDPTPDFADINPTFTMALEAQIYDDGANFSMEPEDKDSSAEETKEPSTEAPGSVRPSEHYSKMIRAAQDVNPKIHFSDCFKRITVELEDKPSAGQDSGVLLDWVKPLDNTKTRSANSPDPVFDRFTMKRRGDGNINVVISLYRDETPVRYRLSDDLQACLGAEDMSRSEVLEGLFMYCKVFELFEGNDKKSIRCDKRLKKILNDQDLLRTEHLPGLISRHLTPMPPIRIPYTIRVDKEFQATRPPPSEYYTIFDIDILTPNLLPAKMARLERHCLPAFEWMKSVDREIARNIQALHHSQARWNFFKAFVDDPVGFTNRWTASQKRDLEMVLGEQGRARAVAEGLSTEVWDNDVVKEAVRFFMNRNA